MELQKFKDLIKGKIMQKDINDFYSSNCLLGIGITSKVYLVTKKDDQSQFASKCVDKKVLQKDGRYFNEIQLMQKLKHNNIIQLIDLYEGENTFYLILEYLEGKSLHELLIQKQSNIEQEKIQQIMKLIIQAIDYMHSQGNMHRDLKPENIMFKQHNQLESLKIVDFGQAILQNLEVYQFPRFGTPGYVANLGVINLHKEGINIVIPNYDKNFIRFFLSYQKIKKLNVITQSHDQKFLKLKQKFFQFFIIKIKKTKLNIILNFIINKDCKEVECRLVCGIHCTFCFNRQPYLTQVLIEKGQQSLMLIMLIPKRSMIEILVINTYLSQIFWKKVHIRVLKYNQETGQLILENKKIIELI